MTIVRTVAALRHMLAPRRQAGETIGLVPTMGSLHEGHLSLVRQARAENDVVVVSIFVNPTQFGAGEDFARYPRDEERDVALLRAAGTDGVFLPAVEEMYPPSSPSTGTSVHVGEIGTRLEGATRPGHFDGVATVVTKLFLIAGPHRAYFGQKDAQQVAVIQQIVRDLHLPVAVRIAPVVREPDGLAMSSRNVYLSATERAAAVVLCRALWAGQALYRMGERDAAAIEGAMHAVLAAESGVRRDYARLVDPRQVRPHDQATPESLLVLAAWVGATRLIDAGPVSGGAHEGPAGAPS